MFILARLGDKNPFDPHPLCIYIPHTIFFQNKKGLYQLHINSGADFFR
jgi:hypothetical protein